MTPGRETPDPVALLPVTLEPADDRREAVANLFQFYVHDFADFWETRRVELQEDGRFPPYPWLDAFWEDPQGEALLIRAGGALVGFVLIDRTAHSGQACDYSMAEFFVARHYRREGIAIVPFEPRIRYLFRAMRPRLRPPSRLADAFLAAVKDHLHAKGWT